MEKITLNSSDQRVDLSGKNAFVLLRLEGCGPCEAVRPQWAQLTPSIMKGRKRPFYVVDVESEIAARSVVPEIAALASKSSSYPTIVRIAPDGSTTKFSDDNARNLQSFLQWINHFVGEPTLPSQSFSARSSSSSHRLSRPAHSARSSRRSSRPAHSRRRSSRFARKSRYVRGGRSGRSSGHQKKPPAGENKRKRRAPG